MGGSMRRRPLLFSLCVLTVACGGLEGSREEPSASGSLEQRLALFDFAASNTNNATDPNNSVHSEVVLNAGETVMIGTCGLTGARYSNDTILLLFDPNGTQVGYGFQSCNDTGSKISYTPSVSGSFLLRAGCILDEPCAGTVAISRRRGAPIAFNAANTHNASINTYNKQYYFNGGDVVRVSTCGYNATGATASGDTYLRLYRNNGGVFTQVAANNSAQQSIDFCDTAAEILYTVPSSGYYQIRAGCDANTACSGNLVVYVE